MSRLPPRAYLALDRGWRRAWLVADALITGFWLGVFSRRMLHRRVSRSRPLAR